MNFYAPPKRLHTEKKHQKCMEELLCAQNFPFFFYELFFFVLFRVDISCVAYLLLPFFSGCFLVIPKTERSRHGNKSYLTAVVSLVLVELLLVNNKVLKLFYYIIKEGSRTNSSSSSERGDEAVESCCWRRPRKREFLASLQVVGVARQEAHKEHAFQLNIIEWRSVDNPTTAHPVARHSFVMCACIFW